MFTRLAGSLTLSLLLLCLAGCAGPTMRVEAEPGPAYVSVADRTGRTIAEGAAPLELRVRFSPEDNSDRELADAETAADAPRYRVTVEPTGANEDRYQPRTTTVTATDYAALPRAATGGQDGGDEAQAALPTDAMGNPVGPVIRRLRVPLDEKPFVSLAYVEVALTPEGQWVGVVTASRAYKDITEAGGAVPAMIADLGSNLGIQGMALSPDSQRVVYAEASYAEPIDDLGRLARAGKRTIELARTSLRGIRIDGGGVQHITTENFLDMFPTFSPNGESILFSSNRRRSDFADILRIQANGRAGIANIFAAQRPALALRPSQALDGTICFAVHHVDESTGRISERQVWTLGGPNQYPTQIARGTQPAISPDGRRIAYIGPDGNLWVCHADGSNQTQLTFDAQGILQRYADSLAGLERARYQGNQRRGVSPVKPYSYPSWSDDGRMILFTSMQSTDPAGRPNEDIWAMAADGSSKQQLTTNGSADRYPLMSADMQNVYFLSNRGQRWSIWRIPAPLEMD